jgi:RNA polymerase sigma-70 factor (ECF subfamily)
VYEVKKVSHARRALVGVAAKEHSRSLQNYIQRWGYNRHDTEDITQEAFLKLLVSPTQTVTEENAGAYLRTITQTGVIDFGRRQSRDNAYIEWTADVERVQEEDFMVANSEPYSTTDLEDQALRSRTLRRVYELIDEMSPTASAALTLYLVNDLSHGEIAQCLGMKEATVRKTISRAWEQLIEQLS